MAAAATLVVTDVAALPRAGDAAPAVRIEDADGRAIALRDLRGKPALVVYEDKGSTQLNRELKADLARLAEGERYRASIGLVAVADVTGYDFWPVRGFVRDAIREESRKQKTTIYCDWTGAFRRALDLRHGTSSVVLYGRDGRVLFAAEGAVPPAERARLLGLLRAEVAELAQAN